MLFGTTWCHLSYTLVAYWRHSSPISCYARLYNGAIRYLECLSIHCFKVFFNGTVCNFLGILDIAIKDKDTCPPGFCTRIIFDKKFQLFVQCLEMDLKIVFTCLVYFFCKKYCSAILLALLRRICLLIESHFLITNSLTDASVNTGSNLNNSHSQ